VDRAVLDRYRAALREVKHYAELDAAGVLRTRDLPAWLEAERRLDEAKTAISQTIGDEPVRDPELGVILPSPDGGFRVLSEREYKALEDEQRQARNAASEAEREARNARRERERAEKLDERETAKDLEELARQSPEDLQRLLAELGPDDEVEAP
jgi:hypothetical protein